MIATSALAIAAYNLAKPFLEKTGEGIARKVGEDVWSLVKKPFESRGNVDLENFAISQEADFRAELEQKLSANEEFKKELAGIVEKSELELSGNFQQNINSYGEVNKQINIQNNSGKIQM